MDELLFRAYLLHKGWTTKQIEDEMSASDMELLMYLFDVLTKLENRTMSVAVNRGMWGNK